MSDPKKLLEMVLTMVKERYEEDSTQAPPMIFACQNDEIVSAIELDFSDPMTKDLSIGMAGLFLQMHPFDASIHVSEAWMSQKSAEEMNDDGYTPPSESPDRVEALICEVSTKDRYVAVMQRMNRGESGNIIGFTELYRVDSKDATGNMHVKSRFDFFGGIKRSVH